MKEIRRYTAYAWEKKRSVVYRALRDMDGKSKVYVLDVGCHEGLQTKKYCEILKEIGRPIIVGLDINPNLKPDGINFCIGDARKLSFKECFDVVISTEVIEHFVEGEQFCNECYRVLKDDGILILTTPNRSRFTAIPRSIRYRIKGERFVPGRENSVHVREYTLRELSEILRRSGFKVIYSEYIAFNPYIHIPERLCFLLDRLSDRFRWIGRLTCWDMVVVAKKR